MGAKCLLFKPTGKTLKLDSMLLLLYVHVRAMRGVYQWLRTLRSMKRKKGEEKKPRVNGSEA